MCSWYFQPVISVYLYLCDLGLFRSTLCNIYMNEHVYIQMYFIEQKRMREYLVNAYILETKIWPSVKFLNCDLFDPKLLSGAAIRMLKN